MLKRFFIVLIVVLVAIQFIRPPRNLSGDFTNDIATVYAVPPDVKEILKRSCYDCHSNYTEYPWYFNIQPLGFWLQHHIDEGKGHLNFSEFSSYTRKKQAHKLEETTEMLSNKEMPLPRYEAMHVDARLSERERGRLIDWATALQHLIERTPAEAKL